MQQGKEEVIQMLISREMFSTVDFPGGSDGKASAYNVGDPGSIRGSGRSPGEGNGYPLQYSCLENPKGRGAWRAAVHGVTHEPIPYNKSFSVYAHPIGSISSEYPNKHNCLKYRIIV